MAQFDTTAEALASFEAQERLQPGQEGWWKVWGASVSDIQAGDLVMCLRETDSGNRRDEFLVQDLYEAQASNLRVGIIVDGEKMTIGRWHRPIVVIRWGTKNTLASSVH